MKKIFSILLSSIMLISLSACGSSSSSTAAAVEDVTQTAETVDDEITKDETIVENAEPEVDPIYLSDGPIFISGDKYQFILTLYSMKTGETTQVFSFDGQRKYNLAIDPADVGNFFHCQLFDSSLSRIAVNWNENGEYHVGWLDKNGNVTDVTNLVHPAGSGFTSQTPKDSSALFTSDDRLVFYDGNQGLYCYYDENSNSIIETYDATGTQVESYPLWGLDTDNRPTSKWMKCGEYYCLVDPSWIYAADVSDIVYYDDGPVFLGINYGEIKHYGCGLEANTEYYEYDGINYIQDKGQTDAITPESEYTITSLAYHDNSIVFTATRNGETGLFGMPYADRTAGDVNQVATIDNSLGTIFFWSENDIALNETNKTVYSASQKVYSSISDFSIIGKWQNIGEGTFGQAQKNSIIAFDGTNCNFFSPMDTYSFSKDGDNYKLICTSYQSTDTLTFTVKTVDQNNIDIYYGDTVIELTRVD